MNIQIDREPRQISRRTFAGGLFKGAVSLLVLGGAVELNALTEQGRGVQVVSGVPATPDAPTVGPTATLLPPTPSEKAKATATGAPAKTATPGHASLSGDADYQDVSTHGHNLRGNTIYMARMLAGGDVLTQMDTPKDCIAHITDPRNTRGLATEKYLGINPAHIDSAEKNIIAMGNLDEIDEQIKKRSPVEQALYNSRYGSRVLQLSWYPNGDQPQWQRTEILDLTPEEIEQKYPKAFAEMTLTSKYDVRAVLYVDGIMVRLTNVCDNFEIPYPPTPKATPTSQTATPTASSETPTLSATPTSGPGGSGPQGSGGSGGPGSTETPGPGGKPTEIVAPTQTAVATQPAVRTPIVAPTQTAVATQPAVRTEIAAPTQKAVATQVPASSAPIVAATAKPAATSIVAPMGK